MSDYIEGLAEAMWAADLENGGFKGRLFREDCDWLAGVLAPTVARLIAAARAEALREAADAWDTVSTPTPRPSLRSSGSIEPVGRVLRASGSVFEPQPPTTLQGGTSER